MSFISLDFAYHRGVDNKFTYPLNWTQILLILFKRPNKVYLIKEWRKHHAKTGFGIKKKCALCVLNLTSTQDLLQASRVLRLVHNILKKMSRRDIVVI